MVGDESNSADGVVTQIQDLTEFAGYTAAQLIAYAQPVLAIKPLGGHGPLTMSSEPTHHRAMLAMLLQAADSASGSPTSTGATASAGDRPRPFVLSDALRPTTRRLAPFQLFEIDGSLRDFAARGAFVGPDNPLQRQQPIQAVSLVAAAPRDRLSVGDTVELSAEVVGGEPNRLYLFLHRVGADKLEVIQDWSPVSHARWTVGSEHRNPCMLELLVAVRNEFGSQHVSAELAVPLQETECHRGNQPQP